jgi:hypothetical protein
MLTIDPRQFVDQFCGSMGGALADFKAILRSIENGTFTDTQQTRSPGKVMDFIITSNGAPWPGSPPRAAADCFCSLVRAFSGFLDRLVAFQRVVRQRRLQVPAGVVDVDEIVRLAKARLADEIAAVARDQRLRATDKIGELAASGETKAMAEALFKLRKCIEHHGSRPEKKIALRLLVPTFLAGDREITEMPFVAAEGESINLLIPVKTRIFPAGELVALTETDIHNTVLTLQQIATEMCDATNARLTEERLAGERAAGAAAASESRSKTGN